MTRPPIVLTRNIDDAPVYGYAVRDMIIYCPTVSECGRFDVDPLATYNLTPDDVRHLATLNDSAGYCDHA